MRRYLKFLHLKGAGGVLDHHHAIPAQGSCDIAALRPISSVLSTYDYWQLAEHHRRCEDLGGALFMRLARLIRAKMADANVVDIDALAPDVVTGASSATFALALRRPETRILYHWGYPDRERNTLPVGTFLGVTLIGMSVGQRMPLLNGTGAAGEVQVLSVHADNPSERFRHN